jgi:2,3-bisphosphoglycerate-independent phosphoglycerate mutase
LDLNSERIKKEKKVKEMMWPWVKTSNTTNNFDNRFKTQEKLLHEQHQMIKGILRIFNLLSPILY